MTKKKIVQFMLPFDSERGWKNAWSNVTIVTSAAIAYWRADSSKDNSIFFPVILLPKNWQNILMWNHFKLAESNKNTKMDLAITTPAVRKKLPVIQPCNIVEHHHGKKKRFQLPWTLAVSDVAQRRISISDWYWQCRWSWVVQYNIGLLRAWR